MKAMDQRQISPLDGVRLFIWMLVLGFCGQWTDAQSSGRIGCVTTDMTMTCFDFYNATLSWSDAWSSCIGNGSQLAMLKRPDFEGLVGDFMDLITMNMDNDFAVWIAGSELDDPTWRWVNGQSYLAQNTSLIMTLFNPNLNRYQNCAMVNSSTNGSSILVVQSDPCKNTRSYICQQNATNATTSTSCSIGSSPGIVIGDQCYAIVSPLASVSWFNARLACYQLNADLATFNESSTADQEAILSLLPNTTAMTGYWVGLRKQPWIWVSGFNTGAQNVSAFDEMWYTDWQQDSPNLRLRSCMAMNGQSGGIGYGWINAKCVELHGYICQQTTILTTTPLSTTTVNTTLNTTLNYTAFDNFTWGMNGTDDMFTSTTPASVTDFFSLGNSIVSIVIPCVIVAIVIIVIGFSIYCYFSQRRDGYIPHP